MRREYAVASRHSVTPTWCRAVEATAPVAKAPSRKSIGRKWLSNLGALSPLKRSQVRECDSSKTVPNWRSMSGKCIFSRSEITHHFKGSTRSKCCPPPRSDWPGRATALHPAAVAANCPTPAYRAKQRFAPVKRDEPLAIGSAALPMRPVARDDLRLIGG